MHGVPCALAICGMARMLRAILSVTATMSCDSTPVPATNPGSSGRICVTGTPAGLSTLGGATGQPAGRRDRQRQHAILFNVSIS